MTSAQTNKPTEFRIRSFVGRNSRSTAAQLRAIDECWPSMGLNVADGKLDFEQLFARKAPTVIEIGFGMGTTLLAAAEKYPEINFIGVEPHRPGVGAVLLGAQMKGLTNIRVFEADVIDVLEKCIPATSLHGVQIFFPDPWQKRRHHARRLIQTDFLQDLAKKIIPGGSVHMATDWEDYAMHIMKVVPQATAYENSAGENCFAERSPYRPIISKFERRAIKEGRQVWEIQLTKLS